MKKDVIVINFTKKQEKNFFNTYKKEVERQLAKPSMQKFQDQFKVWENKDYDKFVSSFTRFMQDRVTDIAEGKRKTVGNYMRDYVNKNKFNYSSKQAKALVRGLTNIEEFADDYDYDLEQQVRNIAKHFNDKTGKLKYSEKVNLVRTDLFNILNEDAGALSSINDTLQQMGEDAQAMLDDILDEFGYLDEDDPHIKKLLDMARFQDSYNRKSYIGNRIFGSPD